MKDRIKKIRRELDLTQQEFAERLGIKRNTVSTYESGRNIPIDAVISLICREFNVREEWLRNGSGEIHPDFTEDEFVKAANMLSNDAFVRSLIVEYCKLDESSKKLFKDFIYKLSDGMKSHESGKNDFPDSHKPGIEPPALTIDDKVERYRKELEREEKAAEKSEALRDGA